jgi:hypothetical protein
LTRTEKTSLPSVEVGIRRRAKSAAKRRGTIYGTNSRAVALIQACPLWMAILLANEEDLDTPGLDLFIDLIMAVAK